MSWVRIPTESQNGSRLAAVLRKTLIFSEVFLYIVPTKPHSYEFKRQQRQQGQPMRGRQIPLDLSAGYAEEPDHPFPHLQDFQHPVQYSPADCTHLGGSQQ